MTKVIVIDPFKETIEWRTIDGSLESLQKLVGGYIELYPWGVQGHDLYVNEEGLINGTKRGFVMTRPQVTAWGVGVIAARKRGDAATAQLKLANIKAVTEFWFK